MKSDKSEEELQVAFVGNPNCGKTTLFNAYTGANLKVANWPGVTVEKKEGAMKYHSHRFKVVDLPGTYSLTSYTMEEKLTRQYLQESGVDVIIDVADASALERNLYLTLQLIELGKPVILALNMMDIVEERGMEIDLHRLPEMLGIPCIPVSARRRTGLDILMHTVAHHKEKTANHYLEHHHVGEETSHHIHAHHDEYAVVYNDLIEDKIDAICNRMRANGLDAENYRWTAIKLLEQDAEVTGRYTVDFSDIVDRNYEKDIINEKYNFIEEMIEECLVNKDKRAQSTDRIDKALISPVFGIPIFLAIMALVFALTFTLGDWLKEGFVILLELLSGKVQELLIAVGAGDALISLIVDGILAGVGGILTFLPNIAVLFLALAFLEDSGYMARVAYIMDGIMEKMGLSGRAFIPMILGFGCTVPAIMASRALEDSADRKRTILVTPFMSCSARLPIYVLFSEVFFGKAAMPVAFSMYIIGLLMALFVAWCIGRRKGTVRNPLLIELPDFKSPNARTILLYVWEKVKDYLTKAGTTIFLASIVIWFLLNFNTGGLVNDLSTSFAASIGKLLAPLLVPLGIGMWQIVVALISGLAAKEVVVSSFSVLFGITSITSVAGQNELLDILSTYGFGAGNAYAFMVFCLLYTPCVATIGVIRRETKSWKMTLGMVLFQLVVAYVMALLVFQLSRLFS